MAGWDDTFGSTSLLFKPLHQIHAETHQSVVIRRQEIRLETDFSNDVICQFSSHSTSLEEQWQLDFVCLIEAHILSNHPPPILELKQAQSTSCNIQKRQNL